MKTKTVFVLCCLMYVCTSPVGRAQGVWRINVEPMMIWDPGIDKDQPLIAELFRGGVMYESIKTQTTFGGMLLAKRIYVQYAHQLLPWRKGSVRLGVTGEFDFHKKSPFLLVGPHITFGKKKNEMINLSVQAGSSMRSWEPALRITIGFPITLRSF